MNLISWEIDSIAFFQILQKCSRNIIHLISRWFVGSSSIRRSTSVMRNLAICTFVCSHPERLSTFRFSCSSENQKYLSISVCRLYFRYQSYSLKYVFIWSISSQCESSFSISFSLWFFSVISGNTMSISARSVLFVSCQNRSCDKYPILSHEAFSIIPLYSHSRQMIIFRRVVFPAPFFPMRAILSRRFTCSSASWNNSVCSIFFVRFDIFTRLDAISAFHVKRYSGIDSRL